MSPRPMITGLVPSFSQVARITSMGGTRIFRPLRSAGLMIGPFTVLQARARRDP